MKKKISILGSTGSIGTSTLDIIKLHPDKYEVVALSCGSKIDVLAEQIKIFNPKAVSVLNQGLAEKLKKNLPHYQGEILFGPDGVIQIAQIKEVDIVISAIVGAAGLMPTLEAIQLGKTIGLANKESMVIAGKIMSQSAKKYQSTILPVDSEHSAIFQCMHGHDEKSIQKIILTASGGPFRETPLDQFDQITIKEALNHPNWDMGPKITIDSATMMNKGLEVMEAKWLFNCGVNKIDVCVHPQSIIHSMVEYNDGTTMAHLGYPDMKVPIGYALSYPERLPTGVQPLKLSQIGQLSFFEPDFQKFPCLKLAMQVAEKEKSYPAVLNAANEIIVDAFLNGKISFIEISKFNEEVLNHHQEFEVNSIEDVIEADSWARSKAHELVDKSSKIYQNRFKMA